MKEIHNPIIHDLIQATLTYFGKEVWKYVKIYIKNSKTKLREYEYYENKDEGYYPLKEYEKEIFGKKRRFDVIWYIKHKKYGAIKCILHEIKTKRFDWHEIEEFYKHEKGRVKLWDFYFLWTWSKYLKKKEINLGGRGHPKIILLPIELLKPVLRKKVKPVLEEFLEELDKD